VAATKEIAVLLGIRIERSDADRVSLTGLTGSTSRSCVRSPRVSLTSRCTGKIPAR
jgi:hypothetical protein